MIILHFRVLTKTCFVSKMINLTESPSFSKTVFHHLEELKLPTDLEMDHVCWRVETEQEYKQDYRYLQELGAELLVEDMIGGRLISTFKLPQAVMLVSRFCSFKLRIMADQSNW